MRQQALLNKLYFYGRLITAGDYKYQTVTLSKEELGITTDGAQAYYTFIVNSNGSIQHSKSQYKEDGDVLIDARTLTDKKYEKEDLYGQDVEFLTTPAIAKYAINQDKDHSDPDGKNDPKVYIETIDPENFVAVPRKPEE